MTFIIHIKLRYNYSYTNVIKYYFAIIINFNKSNINSYYIFYNSNICKLKYYYFS